jgi:hypothetical protein
MTSPDLLWLKQNPPPPKPPFTGDDDAMAAWLNWELDFLERVRERGMSAGLECCLATLSEAEVEVFKENLAAKVADDFGDIKLLGKLKPHLARFFKPPPHPKGKKFRKSNPNAVALLQAAIDAKLILFLWEQHYEGQTRGTYDHIEFAARRWRGDFTPKQIKGRIGKGDVVLDFPKSEREVRFRRMLARIARMADRGYAPLSGDQRAELVRSIRKDTHLTSEEQRRLITVTMNLHPHSPKKSPKEQIEWDLLIKRLQRYFKL